MNKKGFTLAELLGVIIILAVISLIVFPAINNAIKENKVKLYDEQVKRIENMAYRWALDNSDIVGYSGNEYMITLADLKEYGLIKTEDLINPVDNKQMGGCILIRWDDSAKRFDYRYASVCKILYRDYVLNGADPVVHSNMIPVVYDGIKWLKADISEKWYDYSNQMWANAVTVKETGTKTRQEYLEAEAGVEIKEADILTYMVWIPRYEYKYTNLGTSYAGGTAALPGEIGINFISRSTTTPSDSSQYKVHPAFTFGTDELSGFWVGKFETTGSIGTACTTETCTTASLTVKPDIASVRSQTISSMYYASRSMSALSTNIYGYASTVDMHMMKNSEWGAVAYLSQSKYGKYGNTSYTGANKEIYKNDSSSYLTGKSCGGPGSASGTCSTSTADGTYSYNVESNGTGASTTGNIYGVYDMSGGTHEYVMGIYRPDDTTSITDSSGFGATTTLGSLPETKYYDKYTTATATTACSSGICYGHSLSETSGWFSDSASFVSAPSPWFNRGGFSINTSTAGAFYFSNGSGPLLSNSAFRLSHR